MSIAGKGTVASRSLGAFLSAFALAIREVEGRKADRSRLMKRLNQHLDEMKGATSPLSPEAQHDLQRIRAALQKYLNLSSQ